MIPILPIPLQFFQLYKIKLEMMQQIASSLPLLAMTPDFVIANKVKQSPVSSRLKVQSSRFLDSSLCSE